jgi:L-asparaginase II
LVLETLAALYGADLSPWIRSVTPSAVLTLLRRGDLVESVHRGAVAVATSDRLLFALGPVGADGAIFPRSALKPFQALPLLEEGLDAKLSLDAREIALATASHGGDERHVEAARSLLAKGGLDRTQLQCGAHAPMDPAAARRLTRAGVPFDELHHNCSGKHASMLLVSRHLGLPLADYLDPAHPLQQRIRERVALFAGLAPQKIGVAIDGCSAPAFSLPLDALARAMARFADPAGLPETIAGAARRLFASAIAAPHFLSGSRRIELAVMKAASGRTFAKIGAEGVLALGLRPPRPRRPPVGVALKVEDGAERGYFRPALELLRWLGFDPPADTAELPRAAEATLRNYRGLEVGKIEASAEFARLPQSPWT